LNCLTSATYPDNVTQTYTFDKVGNRLTKIRRMEWTHAETTSALDLRARPSNRRYHGISPAVAKISRKDAKDAKSSISNLKDWTFAK
jgi:hypothetical protein